MPRVSIIIPVYNQHEYLAQAIESVKAQSWSDWELVVVDDGSRCGQTEIARVCEDQHTRLIVCETNRGSSAARNIGLSATDSDYVVFLDADDVILPIKLAAQVPFMDSQPEVGLVYSDSLVWYDSTGQVVPYTSARAAQFVAQRRFRDAILVDSIFPCHAALVRRSAVAEVGPFDEDLAAREDFDLWLRIAACHGIEYLSVGYVAKYRQHGRNKTRNIRLMLDSSLQWYRKVFASDYYMECAPDARAKFLRICGTDFCLAGDMETGRRCFREAITLSPRSIAPRVHWGLTLPGHRVYATTIRVIRHFNVWTDSMRTGIRSIRR